MVSLRSCVSVVLLVGLAACSATGGGMPLKIAGVPSQAGGATQGSGNGTASHQDTQGGLPKQQNINVALGDAAPRLGNIQIDKINLAVSEVQVVANGTVTSVGHFDKPVIVDVYHNQDNPGSISTGSVAVGVYDHLQFVLDTTQSAVVDKSGHSYPIRFETDTSTQSSVRAGRYTQTTQVDDTHVAMAAPGPFIVLSKPADKVQADFNAFESLMLDGAGNVVARPTLFAAATDLCAKVKAKIVNAYGDPVTNATLVIADASGNVVNTTNSDSTGTVKMHTLPAGVYRVYLFNQYETAVGQTISSYNTSPGVPSAGYLGVIELSPNQSLNLGRIQD